MLTASQFEILEVVKRISERTGYRIAFAQQIIQAFEDGRQPASTRSRLTELKKLGLLENPFYGGWRLTKKGEKTLEEFEN